MRENLTLLLRLPSHLAHIFRDPRRVLSLRDNFCVPDGEVSVEFC